MNIPTEPDLSQGSEISNLQDRPVVLVEGVSVRYRIPHEQIGSLKEFTIRWIQRGIHYVDFWALREVSLTLKRGEVLGVIGVNGAGKSTLLKVIARVLAPTEGRVVTVGSVVPLLELGSGFHPELTGHENIFLYSAMLGRSRSETARIFDQIVDFADLWDFIDAPLRTYSSGMVARLGFAVAMSTFADLLIIDEVLSVGDTQFRDKCFNRIRTFQAEGASILLVSHNMDTVRDMCTRAMWLSEGECKGSGDPAEVVASYIESP